MARNTLYDGNTLDTTRNAVYNDNTIDTTRNALYDNKTIEMATPDNDSTIEMAQIARCDDTIVKIA